MTLGRLQWLMMMGMSSVTDLIKTRDVGERIHIICLILKTTKGVSFEGCESVYGTASFSYVRKLLERHGVEIPEVGRFEEPKTSTFNFVEPDLLGVAAAKALVDLFSSDNPVIDEKLLFETIIDSIWKGETYIQRQRRQCISLLSPMCDWSSKGYYTVVSP